ncbi:MAG: prolipoprotein diacylglyceryl transferase family protein [Streptosporangiales bacterium]
MPAGIIGGRIYFDITTPKYIPHHWYGVFAVWDGGLGIWGAIALAAVVGAWRVRRHGASPAQFQRRGAGWCRVVLADAAPPTRRNSCARHSAGHAARISGPGPAVAGSCAYLRAAASVRTAPPDRLAGLRDRPTGDSASGS